MEWFGGGRELSEWSSNGTIISNEATVEMSKSEELLKFLAGRGGLPLGNGCDLGRSGQMLPASKMYQRNGMLVV